ncbi:MAG: hypothetical protein FWD03_07890, partial [Defluviitaleaceae bacterium]|nr:hypothetical protein [Defluviitaleaceae bacterium]
SRLQIPDNVLKKRLQNVYFILGEGAEVAKELGRKHGIYVYHTCDHRWKYAQDADPQFQPGLTRIVPDYFSQDPEDAAQWERQIAHDFTPMVIMDLIQLTANHEKIICENAIDFDSIIQFVTHAVQITDYKAMDGFYDQYEIEVGHRDIPDDEKERLVHKVNALREKVKSEGGIVNREVSRHEIKQITLDATMSVEQAADMAANYFGLT